MRLADAIGWLGPASLALALASLASPLAAEVALTLGIVATVTFGVAHGALDHELRGRFTPTTSRETARVALIYACVVGAGFAAFLAAPLPLLAVFLVVSIAHFGTADASFAQQYAGVRGRNRARAFFLGAFPIVLPLIAHPQATIALVPSLSAGEAFTSPAWLVFRAFALGATSIAIVIATLARARRAQTPGWYRCELLVALAAFVFAPPLVAFLLYFGWWHATRHLVRLAEAYGVDPQSALSVGTLRPLAAFAARTLPMTIAALGLAGLLAIVLGRVLPISLIVIALGFAVTVPHTVAVGFFNRAIRERRRPQSPGVSAAGVRAR